MGDRQPGPESVDRRNFLKLASLGGGAAAVSLVVETSRAEAAASAAGPQKSGYAETPHVKAYYASTKF